MTKPNYNDGRWYGWNGGECPVHPKTEVDIVYTPRSGIAQGHGEAIGFVWSEAGIPIIAFRVTKEHKEPREFWLKAAEGKPDKFWCYATRKDDCIHVREVIGDDT